MNFAMLSVRLCGVKMNRYQQSVLYAKHNIALPVHVQSLCHYFISGYILVYVMVLLQETVESGDKHHHPLKGYNITCRLFLQLVRYITMKEL